MCFLAPCPQWKQTPRWIRIPTKSRLEESDVGDRVRLGSTWLYGEPAAIFLEMLASTSESNFGYWINPTAEFLVAHVGRPAFLRPPIFGQLLFTAFTTTRSMTGQLHNDFVFRAYATFWLPHYSCALLSSSLLGSRTRFTFTASSSRCCHGEKLLPVSGPLKGDIDHNLVHGEDINIASGRACTYLPVGIQSPVGDRNI